MQKAETRQISGYTERHHIVPRSLGGSNDASNLVRLTAREHAVCHLMLVRMTEGTARKKMAFAANATLKCRRFGYAKISSRMYQKAKEDYQDARRGVPRSAETRAKLAKSHAGKCLSASHREAIRKGTLKRFQTNGCSIATREKLRLTNIGKHVTPDTKKKLSDTSRGRWWAAAKKWVLIAPDGSRVQVDNLMQFCSDRNLSHASFSKRPNMTPIKKGKSKGWMVLSRE